MNSENHNQLRRAKISTRIWAFVKINLLIIQTMLAILAVVIHVSLWMRDPSSISDLRLRNWSLYALGWAIEAGLVWCIFTLGREFRRTWGVLAIMTTVILIDLTIRGDSLLKDLRLRDWCIYALSGVIEAMLLWCLFTLVSGLGRWRWAIACLIGVFYGFTITAAYEFYAFFQNLPGSYAFRFIFDQPQESLIMSRTQFSLGVIGKTALLTLVVLSGSWVTWKGARRKRSILLPLLLMAIVLFSLLPLHAPPTIRQTYPTLGAMVVSHEGRTLPFSHTIISGALGISDHLSGAIFHSGMQGRFVQPLGRAGRAADRSAVLIISESVRRHNLSLFGYSRKTTPGLDSYRDRYPQSLITYPRSFSEATLTSISVGFMLAGLSPASGIDILQHSHLIHEVIGTLDNLKTAYITSWNYSNSGYRLFIEPKGMDWYYAQETENLPFFCDVGTDDAIVPYMFAKFLETLTQSDHFFAVIHLSNTHFPYCSPPGTSVWSSKTTLDAYDSAILYQDIQVTKILKAIEDRGRLGETLVFYTSDHGEGLGIERPLGHGGPRDDYSVGVPIWAFTPLDIRFANVRDRLHQAASRNVCNSDLAPTILEYFGFNPHTMPTSRLGLLSKNPTSDPIFIYDWRLGFTDNRSDYLTVVSGDYLLNAVSRGDQLSYHLTSVLPPYEQQPWISAPDSLKTSFLTDIRQYKGLRKFAP